MTCCPPSFASSLILPDCTLRTFFDQILEQEEQKQKCRLERIELLLQLRMLQHEQPWGAYQKALESKGSVPASCSGIGSQKRKLAIMLSANGTDTANSRDDTGQAGHEIENDPAPEHPVDDGNDSINSVVGASVPEARFSKRQK